MRIHQGKFSNAFPCVPFPWSAGDRITFQDPDRYQWYDPTLWRAASTPDDLENGRFQFSVHEESVPCEHDDVIFRPDSSFRVSTDADVSHISLRSVSIMEKVRAGGRAQSSNRA